MLDGIWAIARRELVALARQKATHRVRVSLMVLLMAGVGGLDR